MTDGPAIEAGTLVIRSEREASGEHRVALSGEFDLAGAGAFEAEMLRVEATDAGAIVVDLGGLAFIDSTGLRLLLAAHERSAADSRRLVLRRGSAKVQRVFAITGLEGLLPFADAEH